MNFIQVLFGAHYNSITDKVEITGSGAKVFLSLSMEDSETLCSMIHFAQTVKKKEKKL